MENNKLKDIIDREYEHIPIPEGLEERLSTRIDYLATKNKRKGIKLITFIVSSVAAALLVVFTLNISLEKQNLLADTCQSPEEAYKATEEVLLILSQSLQKGAEGASLAEESINSTTKKVKQLL